MMSREPTTTTFLSFRNIIAPSLLLAPFLFPSSIAANDFPRQRPIPHHNEVRKNGEFRVAIIGAGIAGASAAYHLGNKSTSGSFQGTPVAITILESSDEVGGQVRTISPPGYDRSRWPLELGASSFFEEDWCLTDAARATKTILSQSRKNRHTDDGRWIFNGSHFLQDRMCEKTDLRPRFWRWREVKSVMNRALDLLRFELTHRFLPWRIRRRLKIHSEQFRDFGQNGTFDNVMQELERCGLGHEVFSNTASDFLNSMGMTRDFQRTFLEPCMKEVFGLSSDEALGLHAVLSAGAIRPNLPVVATDGQQRFIDRMIKKSEAKVQLNSTVVRVEAGTERRYALTVTSNGDGEEKEHLEYDAIVATGDALRNFRSLGLRASPKQQITTYKTYFSTLYNLDSNGIGVKSGSVPRSVLFATKKESSGPQSDQSLSSLTTLTTWPGFYIDRTGCVWDDECDQFLHVYITESTSPLSRENLSRLTRDDFINWIKSHSWQRNLPVAFSSEPSFGDVQVEDFLFDAGNMVLDSMEMSCRMGRNIALKIMGQPFGATQNLNGEGTWTEADLLGNIQGLL
ncbi:hypothetical protein DM02DRAFT_676905 [Periconia macrospinosa]|uniref:Amine oxidase domain-containing protein n=1 Tax=Periconia macrospinosa TaxID=97972 RepID=A0A2V1D5M4_9PLEO|nr:hypothetical protein DM02DRAFT_676905 [Periconia macrospinosa]